MRTRTRFELVVMAAVAAAVAALLGFGFLTVGPPDTDSEGYLPVLVVWAVLSAPSLVAARILCRSWWRREDTRDGPERLLGRAVGALPQSHRDWGAAMVAELAEVRGPMARARFAVGCARAALFPPSSGRGPLLAGAVTVAAAPTAGLAVGQALPALRVFTVMFLVLLGALAAFALSRPRALRPPASGPVVTVFGLAGVVTAIALAAYVLVQDPPAERALGSSHALVLAVFLAGCLWLVLAPPRALTTGRLARGAGLATAVLLGVCFVWSARTGDVLATYVFLPPVVLSFLGSAVAAAVRRSFRTGVQTTVWTTVTGTLLVFACWLVEGLHRFRVEGALLLDGETRYPVGTNVTDAVFWVLVFVPVWGLLPFGVMGAAFGSRLPRLLRPAR
ncbi:hypothetical protein [Streptomyces coerulescens]|uniref:Integral membrane protein n=1 Tax=Streptomyces coerulescens TaxID=29304 RepID=A0ABW0CC28_STRCD